MRRIISAQARTSSLSIMLAPEGKELLRATGKALMEKGFEVTLANKYDGNIYEVTNIDHTRIDNR